ncbi:MAG: hypothetical protein U0792_13485 [Gemmataceae bacterium]
MVFKTRQFAIVILAGLTLVAAGCGSNNAGKIEGKWKIVSAPGLEDTNKQLEQVKAYLYMEFRPDGTMSMGADFEDPAMKEIVEKFAAKSGEKTSFSWKYKLLTGDNVEFYDLPKELQEKGTGGLFGGKDKARTSVKIDGDNMTMTDSDGKTGKFVRIKPGAEPAKKPDEAPKKDAPPKPGPDPKKK